MFTVVGLAYGLLGPQMSHSLGLRTYNIANGDIRRPYKRASGSVDGPTTEPVSSPMSQTIPRDGVKKASNQRRNLWRYGATVLGLVLCIAVAATVPRWLKGKSTNDGRLFKALAYSHRTDQRYNVEVRF